MSQTDTMRKHNQQLAKKVKPHGFTVTNAIGHGANVVDGNGRILAKVHLQEDSDVTRAYKLLARRGYLEKP